MDDILISTQGGTAILTVDSPLSHYGIPVLRILRIEAEYCDGDLGPADLIGNFDDPKNLVTAAEVVAGWASQEGRTAEELKAASAFLRQWADGPQIDDILIVS